MHENYKRGETEKKKLDSRPSLSFSVLKWLHPDICATSNNFTGACQIPQVRGKFQLQRRGRKNSVTLSIDNWPGPGEVVEMAPTRNRNTGDGGGGG